MTHHHSNFLLIMKRYWTLVHDHDDGCGERFVGALDSLPVFAALLFLSKNDAEASADVHREHWQIDCHVEELQLNNESHE